MSKSKEFEKNIQRLEEIVKQLEAGETSLEDALKLFQEGTALVSSCTQQLDKAELEVKRLTKGAAGEPVESEFEHDDA